MDILTSKFSRNRHPEAMKTARRVDLFKTDRRQECEPHLGRAFRLPVRFSRTVRFEVQQHRRNGRMQSRGMSLSALGPEPDQAGLNVRLGIQVRLGQSTALMPRDFEAVMKKCFGGSFGHGGDIPADDSNMAQVEGRLLLGRRAFDPQFPAWIGCGKIPVHRFLHNQTEGLQLQHRCVSASAILAIGFVGAHSPVQIFQAVRPCQVLWNQNALLSEEQPERLPSYGIAKQALRVLVVPPQEKGGHPLVPMFGLLGTPDLNLYKGLLRAQFVRSALFGAHPDPESRALAQKLSSDFPVLDPVDATADVQRCHNSVPLCVEDAHNKRKHASLSRDMPKLSSVFYSRWFNSGSSHHLKSVVLCLSVPFRTFSHVSTTSGSSAV